MTCVRIPQRAFLVYGKGSTYPKREHFISYVIGLVSLAMFAWQSRRELCSRRASPLQTIFYHCYTASNPLPSSQPTYHSPLINLFHSITLSSLSSH